MATAKKAPVAAKKSVPAKKAGPVAQKTAPVVKAAPVAKKEAAPAVKYKPGQAVVGTSGHGQKTKGRFVSMEDTDRGLWVNINVAPKGKPAEIKRYRPKAVSAA